MEISELARTILRGTSLADKLIRPGSEGLTDVTRGDGPEAAAFPGRPAGLAPPGSRERAAFPAAERLRDDPERGRVLHFFANHELLAMELMALALLKFPDAPPAFRAGLARTIGEEQAHLELYLARMQELGVGFGELPVSRYFWDVLHTMRSPMEFVLQMSLTFEQANLDYSAHYRDLVAAVGDEKTARLLDRVYREEIGHVKHGVQWFNRWRDAGEESDWDAYCRLLPPPLTPRRARGLSFQVSARREAGLSLTFCRALAVQGGSRGRPRVVWLHNPLCETEIARGAPGLIPGASRMRVAADLAHVPMFLASHEDVVVAPKPRLAWLEELARAGVAIPEFAPLDGIADDMLAGLEPWGWSPEAVLKLAPLAGRLAPTPGANGAWANLLFEGDARLRALAPLYSKSWSARWLARWLAEHPEWEPAFGRADEAGVVVTHADEARARVERWLADGRPAMVKAPYGTAGTQVRRIGDSSELAGAGGAWMRNRLGEQGGLVVEPYCDRTSDLSVQLQVSEAGVEIVGVRRFMTGPRFEYRGTCLGDRRAGFCREEMRFLNEEGPCGRPAELLDETVRAVGGALAAAGYRGPAGVDAFVHRTPAGLRLRPVVEVNPRWTMGRVALALEALMEGGTTGAFFLVPVKRLAGSGTVAERAAAVAERHPRVMRERGERARIERGVLWTTDPVKATDLLTVLAVGDASVEEIRSMLD